MLLNLNLLRVAQNDAVARPDHSTLDCWFGSIEFDCVRYIYHIYINCLKVRAHFLSWYLKYLIFVTVWYYIECESVVCVCFGFSICSTYDKII